MCLGASGELADALHHQRAQETRCSGALSTFVVEETFEPLESERRELSAAELNIIAM